MPILPAVLFWTPGQKDFDDFAALSGDDNPIHVDPAFSARTRFGRTVSHGMLLYARVFAWLEELFPARTHAIQHLMFPNPAYADEELAFHFSVDPEKSANILIEVRRSADDALTLSGSCCFGDAT